MNIAAVVCEYNPFHQGHAHQLKLARELLKCDAVTGIMSGNFVQRGSAAIFPKDKRAKAALNNGMDLVLELPSVLTLQSAERYARNTIMTLDAMGCIDTLFFGAECPDTDVLVKIAQVLANEDSDFKNHLHTGLSNGLSFAAARSEAIRSILGDASAKILSTPNNILAVEYCKALIRCNSSIHPYALPRKGTEHDSCHTDGVFASATEIRRRIYANEDYNDFLAENTVDSFNFKDAFYPVQFEKAMIANLCKLSPNELSYITDVSEGLEYALIRAAFENDNLNSVIEAVKSKRYAYSRLRRIITNAYLGITKADEELLPQYIRILDFNEKGQEVLNNSKKTAALPLAKNGGQIKGLPDAQKLWQRELIIDRIYNLYYNNFQE